MGGFSGQVPRPILPSRGGDVPVWVILVGTLGGLLEHRLLGLFVGPIVVSLGYRLFQVWIAPAALPPEPGQQRQALTHSIEWSRDGGPR